MSSTFATKLSILRRERNITQKNAAESLGVSQALLSHYEKGIRECNMDFIRKAAAFYEVTSDYLLGISESKHGNNEIFDLINQPSDEQFSSKTLLRVIYYLQSKAEFDSPASEKYFNDFFSLCIKKYLSFYQKSKTTGDFCDISIKMLKKSFPELQAEFDADEPLFIETILNYTNDIIAQDINNVLK